MGFAQKKQPAKSRQAVLIPAVCRKGVRPPTKRLTALIEILPRISNIIGSGGIVLPSFPRNGRPANRVILVRKHSLCVGRPPYKMDNTRFCRFCQWNWKKIGALCNFQKSSLADLCNILHSMEKQKTLFPRTGFSRFFHRKQRLDLSRFPWFHSLFFPLKRTVFF